MLVSFAGDTKQTTMPRMYWANEEKRHHHKRNDQMAVQEP